MLLIVVLTSVVGVALGWATAVALGLVAAGVCIAVMAQRHRRQPVDDGRTR
jgi:ABC-type phosphate/phosphonate transport system permease subunit